MQSTDKHIEKELLMQVSRGDESAFRAVYDLYKAPFYATALKMTRSSDAAEEILQEVFIALWNNRAKVGEASNPVGYLFTMLHNSVCFHFRKLALEKRMKLRVLEQAEEQDQSMEEMLLAKEKSSLLQAVVRQLPRQQQLVYQFSKHDGLSREEIATKLNISPNTVKNHLAKALEFIRQYFKKGASAIIWAIIWSNQ